MILMTNGEVLQEFRTFLGEEVLDWPREAAAAMFWAFLEPGHSVLTQRFYREDRVAFIESGYSLSDDAERALLDIPDEIDPHRADVAAVLVAYRVADGSLACRVWFGDEALQWRPRPLGVDAVADEMCPL